MTADLTNRLFCDSSDGEKKKKYFAVRCTRRINVLPETIEE